MKSHKAGRNADTALAGSKGSVSHEPVRILVADDSPVSRKMVEHALELEPYTILFAESGQEAVQKCGQYQPHIVITDWVMPDFSGPDLCRRIRQGTNAPYIYIILLTSSSDMDRLVEGLEAGADDYLTKPFHAKELIARIGVGQRIIAMQRQIEAKNRLLELAAGTDHLTGISNRRAVEEFAAKQISGATRYKFPLWVIVADLDRFKFINDTYGHASGDEVLQHFAKILRANTRAADICGRLGGDEFVLMLTHSPAPGVAILIERLRSALGEHDFGFDGDVVKVTATFGFAEFDQNHPKNFTQLLADADAVLYQEKSKRQQPAAH